MYIEEITLEGFKSYATRVTVPNFDPFFNAITGLNGSGKSNILDSICFVLGITNLSQVRASNLQELVYKQGQAGVTKASVSIVFNNADKANSPVGYEQHDQITVTRQLVIGGRNKYLINGHAAQPSRVQNLFHSVQLNVNNPHFLIMQGRITKVLNMKPPEILGMLEEAAGTRMYEMKKDAALRTLEKKQVKVEEINAVLKEEILPALERLRREKGQFLEWQAANANIDRLRRFCVAYRIVETERRQADRQAEVGAGQARLGELAAAAAEAEAEAGEIGDRLAALATEKELQAGGEVKELAAQADALAKQLVRDTAVCANKGDTLKAERAACDQLRAAITELGEEALTARTDAAAAAHADAVKAEATAAAAVEAGARELAGAEAGDGRDESNRSLQERLADAQTAQTAAEADAKQAEVRGKHLAKRLAEQRKAATGRAREAAALAKDLAGAEAAVAVCERRLQELGYDESAEAALEASVKAEAGEVRRCRGRVDELASTLSGMDFSYKDPERGFDRGRVKGVVARLVRVKDASAATALEVAAGGKLYQVVVDSEATAKALLARGQLRNRVTIVPLNKVAGRVASAAVQASAARLGAGRAALALELVGFDQDLSAAMRYVFGNAFVCQDASTAKALAFAREVKTRCVTLDGDDFNPSGTLTGGSRNKGTSVLARLHALAEAEAELAAHAAALQGAEAQLQARARAADEHRRLAGELELKRHALGLLRERVAGSESAQLAEAVAASEAEAAEADSAAKAARERKAAMAASAKELEKQIASFGRERDKHVKAAQAKVKAARTGAEQAKAALKAAATALAEAVAEGEAAAAERANLAQQLATAEAGVAALEAEVAQLEGVVARSRDAHAEVAEALQARRAALTRCDEAMAAATAERQALRGRVTDLQVERKRLEHKLGRAERDIREGAEHARRLAQEYPWVASERQFFGRAGGDYDWASRDPEAAFAELEKAEDTLGRLGKGLNKRVMQMFDKAEAEFRELSDKRGIVENDKSKIQKVIAELDEKKREALEKTWRKVDADFGSIFSTLLPGTSAKLEPPEDATFLAGLEVRVAFGGVWKESLTELSGGQRSLLALSLILAMLLFKPAPIYILDEVDAALDLSHTQNIGRMIKSHFPYSQFIVVSLKEGMFSNANVLFRTKFVDGVSAVTRTVNARSENDGPRSKGAARRPERPALTENLRAA
ncbi:hypothetical protein WJX81_006911 [Elliptochloris bilobata]|uniref:Structural maintenance of chromosomes protein n=1 Tax=Elliptochloris bilobata TaxID=381761 RepID=A0AAW1RPH7_9CHLO